MKRSEITALLATLGLIVAAVLCFAGALYGQWNPMLTAGRSATQNALWAGMFAAIAHAIVAGLATWGIRLSRQQAELAATPEIAPVGSVASEGGFRMSVVDYASPNAPRVTEARTLETGFQRVLVCLAGVVHLAFAAIIVILISVTVKAYNADPSKGFPVPPQDPLTIVIAAGVVAVYISIIMGAPIRRGTENLDEPVNNMAQIGVIGAVAIFVCTLIAWWGGHYAAEAAAGIFAFLIAVQGLELIANSLRSYAAIEEFDQAPLDLQATPFVPMLSSGWIPGLRMLAADSLGVRRNELGERGVFARMMPRTLVATVVLAVLVSMLRVVPPGQVAVLERWGHVAGCPNPDEINKNLLGPGLHLTAPWPIDQLIYIPKDEVRMLPVGREVESSEGAPVNHHFWAIKPRDADDTRDQLVTGDHDPQTNKLAPQLLESFAGVWWRVRDPGRFYMRLSHSEFFEEGSGGTKSRPIFEALVQQYAWQAMTRGFATHSGEAIMTTDRVKVENACRAMLQEALADAGIEVVQFTIKDVHPPFGKFIDAGNGEIRGSPAFAYENVVRKLEEKERDIVVAHRKATVDVLTAKGEGPAAVLAATGQRHERVSAAKAEAARMSATVKGYTSDPDVVRMRLYFNALADILGSVNKVIVGKDVSSPTLIQQGREGAVNVTPLPPTPPGPPR